MKIDNVNSETSLKGVVDISLVIACVVGLPVIILVVSLVLAPPTSFGEVFGRLFYIINEISDGDWFIKILLHACVTVLPAFLIFELVNIIKKRNTALALMKNGINLKNVELLQNRINFKFFNPKYNFVCKYSDIENLKMTVRTGFYHTSKGGKVYTVEEVSLAFQVLNNKTFNLSNTASINPINFIYKVIDYSRRMGHFNAVVVGSGMNDAIKEKIDTYQKTGYKRNFAKSQENTALGLSVFFFILGLIFLFPFGSLVVPLFQNHGFDFIMATIILAIPSLLIIISGVIDIRLYIDEVHFSSFTNTQLFSKKFPFIKLKSWQIIGIKIVILLKVISMIFAPVI